jgi:birA, biotin-[acetyl-CoA-carboxylase] ligase region
LITLVDETGSTNADLASRLLAGDYLAEGDWLVANRQTAGKGRQGRVWNDGSGNFMGSTVVRPGPGDPSPATLALMTGIVVHGTVRRFVADQGNVALKWPNDLLLDGAKVAGILLEMRSDVVIVGIGVNLVHSPDIPGRKVTALVDHGNAPERDVFAQILAGVFETELQRWRSAGLAPLLRRWQSAAHDVGTRLTVLPPGEEEVTGTFAGLAPDGNLLLSLVDGSIRMIHAGDVLLSDAPR